MLIDTLMPLGLPTQRALITRGLPYYGGRVCLVAVDQATGEASGASDSRGGGGLSEL